MAFDLERIFMIPTLRVPNPFGYHLSMLSSINKSGKNDKTKNKNQIRQAMLLLQIGNVLRRQDGKRECSRVPS
jgi:hypothetical protein